MPVGGVNWLIPTEATREVSDCNQKKTVCLQLLEGVLGENSHRRCCSDCGGWKDSETARGSLDAARGWDWLYWE
jgi:hypothetical protein